LVSVYENTSRGKERMMYIFPETKFVRENTVKQQIDHVISESIELHQEELMEDDTDYEYEEAMDLYHSLETLFRIWEREGVDMEAVRQKVLEKNRARGYYANDKYHNRKTTIDGITFDSKREAERYCELKLLQKAGKICRLSLQPKYLLLQSFKKNGKTFREINYIADFAYHDIEKQIMVVEDVKGVETEAFKIKRKMFEAKYPEFNLVIIK
jgi:hypothetical protein